MLNCIRLSGMTYLADNSVGSKHPALSITVVDGKSNSFSLESLRKLEVISRFLDTVTTDVCLCVAS